METMGSMRSIRSIRQRRALLLRCGILVVSGFLPACEVPPHEPASRVAEARPTDSRSGQAELLEAFRERRSNQWVEASARVRRLLSEDRKGSRHQRFLVEVAGGQTVLISHNIDLAPRVPVVVGSEVRFRGEYEWNDRGGVVHWTHHDPARRQTGGWIEHQGRRYE